jgi:hypothetical protein
MTNRPFDPRLPRRAPAPRCLNALAVGANPHTRARRRARLAVVSAAFAVGSWVAACDRAAPGDAGASSIDPTIAELIAAQAPPDPTSTSDVQDAWFRRKAELVERLRAGSPELGRAALRAFSSGEPQSELARAALLDVGAHCAPAEAAPLLGDLIATYDPGVGLGLRTFAVELLARTSPAVALERIEPILREAQPRATRPPQEAFVRAWAAAARASGVTEPAILCDVAADLAQPADARYAAIDELGSFGGMRAQKALEEVLREANSDGLMRRKAAQALAKFAPKDELCAALEAAARDESDESFLYFHASMIERHCGG